jgi:hypothetical protein
MRYAGLLNEAADECQTALALDRGDYLLHTCSFTLMQLNQPQAAMEFVRLDPNSEYAARSKAYIELREGKPLEALKSIQMISTDSPDREMLKVDLFEACLDPSRRSSLDHYSRQAETEAMRAPNQETKYFIGAILAYCGQRDAAARLIKSAIKHNYCAYTALQTDPLWEKLRGSTKYSEVLLLAKECQSRFATLRTGLRSDN